MVVMETVRAATLASSRRKERLTSQQTKPSLPLAASSPSGKKHKGSGINPLPIDIFPPSPIVSGNSTSTPDEIVRYRNQNYVAPEKLQIVKPLEGSVTLLKWKLLASPQLGGATSFFSDAARPGVHLKKWKAGGVIDDGHSKLAGTKVKSRSTTDLGSLQYNFLYQLDEDGSSAQNSVGVGLSVSMDAACANVKANSTSANAVQETEVTVPSRHRTKELSNRSLLGQVGSFLGSGWSHLGFGANSGNSLESHDLTHHKTKDTGLSVLLDTDCPQ